MDKYLKEILTFKCIPLSDIYRKVEVFENSIIDFSENSSNEEQMLNMPELSNKTLTPPDISGRFQSKEFSEYQSFKDRTGIILRVLDELSRKLSD
jgi:hypothetical protein